MFKCVFLPLVNYPFPTLPFTIGQAVSVAQIFGAELSALSIEMDPPLGLGYATHTMPNVGTVISAEEAKATANKGAVTDDFLNQANKVAIPHNLARKPGFLHELPNLFAAAARFCDISLLPVDENASFDPWYGEGVIFGSGHPCLILPQGYQVKTFQRAVIAWDGSRAAVRSISEALPLLSQAADVLVVTATPDKTVAASDTEELIRYLQRHGVQAAEETVELEDRSPAEAISHRANSYHADFIVMGAFGHSRLRDFILGGTTKDMLAKPPLPVFMAY